MPTWSSRDIPRVPMYKRGGSKRKKEEPPKKEFLFKVGELAILNKDYYVGSGKTLKVDTIVTIKNRRRTIGSNTNYYITRNDYHIPERRLRKRCKLNRGEVR